MHPTHSSIIDVITAAPPTTATPAAAAAALVRLRIRSDYSAGVSTVIGLIVSALQIRRTKRVIAHGAVPTTPPPRM